jgi:hypothetical protein
MAPAADAPIPGELAAAEDWFHEQGLPWFVDAADDRVRDLLRRRRVWLLGSGCGVVAVAAGLLTYRVAGSWPSAFVVGLTVALVLVLGYAGGPLRVATMARWAARRVVRELDLLFPLVTRALPLLLLFMTFLFVNTEVWQVTAALDRPTLYTVVLLFTLVGTAFLLTRLPEEVRQVERAAAGDSLIRACQDTPLADHALQVARETPGGAQATLSTTQRANLVLVLWVTQAIQVTLLTAIVFAFFLGFGLLTISSTVVQQWLGHAPTPISWDLGPVHVALPVSNELYQVSVFLAVFAGLYFTVYAVSDSTYREQFFAHLSQDLERAIGVRTVYRALLTSTRPGTDA